MPKSKHRRKAGEKAVPGSGRGHRHQTTAGHHFAVAFNQGLQHVQCPEAAAYFRPVASDFCCLPRMPVVLRHSGLH